MMSSSKDDKLTILELEIKRLERKQARNFTRISAIKFANSKVAREIVNMKNIVRKVREYE